MRHHKVLTNRSIMVQELKVCSKGTLRATILLVLFTLLGLSPQLGSARPVEKVKKGGAAAPEKFARQTNNYSNMFFYLTNKGVIFNQGNGQAEGLFWPRGSSNSYIFGGGLWFGLKKVISGRLTKLAEIGYNPNSGAGWYGPGEYNDEDLGTKNDAKYITYFSPRYDQYAGSYVGGANSFVPDVTVNWPLWDTSSARTLKQNFYFGDYISKVGNRNVNYLQPLVKGGKTPKPAMFSQEDMVDVYDDQDVTQNPEFKPNTGYPFGINIIESIYSWSFGRYRDLVFVRYKLTNTSKDNFLECYMAPAFDPDLATAANDLNSYVSDADSTIAKLNPNLPAIYQHHPSKLNMGWQWSQPESGQQYGVIGFSFLESPTVDQNGQLVDNSDSTALGGYTSKGLQQLGLRTFQKWTINNDPSTQDLRYDFMAQNTFNIDHATVQDMRLLLATGPFNLKAGQSVTTTVGIGIALASTTTLNMNEDSLLNLMAFAQGVFNNPIVTTVKDSVTGNPDTVAEVVTHFLSPIPPSVSNVSTQSLDKAVLVTWDSSSENSIDPISSPIVNGQPTKSLPFVGYQLYRTTRSDHDSTIRPTGINPTIKLGEWALYTFKQDTTFDKAGRIAGYYYVRINKTPNPIPHSYLDVGDDNHNGTLDAGEGLYNGVTYYYYLIAYDEYDSVNKVGPLYTSIVPPKNFVSETPTKPPFVGIPDSATLSTGLGCLSGAITNALGKPVGGITGINISIVDTGKFEVLFTNDVISVSFQPRWAENINQYFNQSALNMFVNVSDSRQGHQITYDANYNPNASPPITPYNFATGNVRYVAGQQTPDSIFTGTFNTNNNLFAPYQLVDQAFSVTVNYQFEQQQGPYRMHSIVMSGHADQGLLRLSGRTLPGGGTPDFNNLDSVTNPSFLGMLGADTYEIDFGNAEAFSETDLDTAKKQLITIDSVYDKGTKSVFYPQVLPLTIKRVTPGLCGTLKPIRPGVVNDYTPEFNCFYYSPSGCQSTVTEYPSFSDPDSMLVPIPGHFAVDVFHYTDVNQTQHTSPSSFTGPLAHTIGSVYFPNWGLGNFNATTKKYHLAVHRIRLAGAEIFLNAPGIPSPEAGDSTSPHGQQYNDFQAGDKITVAFSGGIQGMPMPDTAFQIKTDNGNPTNYANATLYDTQAALDQVQVVPNPYIVTHIGQQSTDFAKLYFTRLPPRCTIEIYSISGILIKTIEHNGYASTSTTNSTTYQTTTTYNYDQLGDASSRETWNLLSDGGQRVGSQVLIARIIARDPKNGNAEIGETTTKFAVVLGGYHIAQ